MPIIDRLRESRTRMAFASLVPLPPHAGEERAQHRTWDFCCGFPMFQTAPIRPSGTFPRTREKGNRLLSRALPTSVRTPTRLRGRGSANHGTP